MRPGVKKKFQKTFILAFDVIVQPPKHTFEIALFPRFSSLCKLEGLAASFFTLIITRNSQFCIYFFTRFRIQSWKKKRPKN